MNRRLIAAASTALAALVAGGLSALPASATESTWTAPAVLQPFSKYLAVYGRVPEHTVSTSDGRTVSVFYGEQGIEASIRHAGTSSWSTPVVIAPDAWGGLVLELETDFSVAAAPNGDVVAAWPGQTGVTTRVLYAGSTTWSPERTVSTEFGAEVHTGYSSDGTAAVVWTTNPDYSGPVPQYPRIQLATLSPGARAWASPQLVAVEGPTGHSEPNAIVGVVGGPNRQINILWRTNNYDSLFDQQGSGGTVERLNSRSFTPSTGIWADPVVLSNPDLSVAAVRVATGSDGTSAAFWTDTDPRWGVAEHVATFGASGWSPAVDLGSGPEPAIALAGGTLGTFAALWTSATPDGHVTRAVTFTPNEGWSAPQLLSDPEFVARFPAIDARPSGGFTAAWIQADSRLVAPHSSVVTTSFASDSSDWTTPTPVPGLSEKQDSLSMSIAGDDTETLVYQAQETSDDLVRAHGEHSLLVTSIVTPAAVAPTAPAPQAPVAPVSHPSPPSSGGRYTAAFSSSAGMLSTAGVGVASARLGMRAGTSPAITALPGGGHEMAFQANTGALWTVGTAGTRNWGLGMKAGTSPSITAVPGGYEVAFQANTGILYTVGAAGTRNWGLGMRAGTSPSIMTEAPDAYQVAFQANTGQLWTAGTLGAHNWGYRMAAGTSPSITAVLGGYQFAFQSSAGMLWTAGSENVFNWDLPMQPGTSPAITTGLHGSFRFAYQAVDGTLWTDGEGAPHNWGLGMKAGTSPAIVTVPGGFEMAIQANTGSLWTVGTAGAANWSLPMSPGSSPAIAR